MSLGVIVQRRGSIVTVEPRSEDARDWLTENCSTEEWQWTDGKLAVDPRIIDAIVDGLAAAGFGVAAA